MNYWKFKFNAEHWINWDKKTIGDIEDWRSPKTRGGKPNDIAIGDIVFLYRTDNDKKRGIYFVSKVINVDFSKEYPIDLEIIKDLKENIFKPENFGFENLVKKFKDLMNNGNYYKITKEDNPEELYNLIMNDETDNLLPEQFNDEEVNKLTEGAKKEITVNAYERSSQARQKCIEKYGTKCSVCNFDFEQKYGKIGKDFIHVHHLTTISSIAENYEVNPIEDLRPVCPNCHAMLHKKQPEPYTINELKEIIKNNIVTTIEIKFSGHSGSFNNAMIMHGEAKFHQENINKLISKCKSIDEVMEILKQYFEEKQPKHCTDITATIDGDIFSIKKDLTSYEQISI